MIDYSLVELEEEIKRTTNTMNITGKSTGTKESLGFTIFRENPRSYGGSDKTQQIGSESTLEAAIAFIEYQKKKNKGEYTYAIIETTEELVHKDYNK